MANSLPEDRCKTQMAPVNDAGELIFEEYEKLVNKKTKLVALTHISNALAQ